MRWGSVVSRFPDSPDSPSRTSNFNSLRPRVGSDYFSLEDKVVFWCSGAYKKYPRSYGADHRVCGGHCPTSGHSGPRTPVNDLNQREHSVTLRTEPAVHRPSRYFRIIQHRKTIHHMESTGASAQLLGRAPDMAHARQGTCCVRVRKSLAVDRQTSFRCQRRRHRCQRWFPSARSPSRSRPPSLRPGQHPQGCSGRSGHLRR